jgi:AcrR family transcriptional regulator
MPRKPREGLRDDLIAAAEKIIREQGFPALTARLLATEAKCAVGTLYNVFGDLHDLVVEVNGRTLSRLVPVLAAARNENAGPEDQVMSLAFAYINFISEEQHLWTALMQHHLPEGRTVPDWYLAKLGGLFTEVEAAITPLFEGRNNDELKRAARILWSNMHGLCSLVLSDKLDLVSGDNIETLAEDMVYTYLAGIKATR